MSVLELKLFGGLNISLDGAPLLDLKSQKGQALLCYLAITHKRYTRSALAGLFWTDMPQANALMNLRKVLNRIKPVAAYLSVSRDMLAFNQEAPYWLDIDEFCAAATAPSDANRLLYAASLYQGDFLDGFTSDGSPLFDEWILEERVRLRNIAVNCLQQLVKILTSQHDYPAAIRSQRRLLSIEPWHEKAHRELMLLLALYGQRSAALRQYETCRSILAKELGVDPNSATDELYEQIKADKIQAERSPPQLSKTLTGRLLQSNLPVQTTPFIGRVADLAILQRYLADPGVRLVTIIGPGGIGKTRLALACAYKQAAEPQAVTYFPHGVYFVSLAGVETSHLILPAIAEALALRFADGEDPTQQLLNFLRHKEMLLVLDNYEHLLAGTELIDQILRVAQGIKLVITSREKLNRRAEYLLPVSGLAYPSEDSELPYTSQVLVQYSAIQLFEQSARRIKPGFVLSAENQQAVLGICRLVQGMPLGIVLAATWIEMLAPHEILDEMNQDLDFLKTEEEDVPDRQRSLRAAFNHSWRRLTEHERSVFRQLSVFRGGFTLRAAQLVVGAILHDLQTLVHKSLLSNSKAGRYDVHELMRQFAAEELDHSPDLAAAVRSRHSAYYCAFLREHDQDWHNARQMETLAAVTAEADNAQTAWNWAVKQMDWHLLLDAIDSWGWYHEWRGRFTDGEVLWKEIVEKAENFSGYDRELKVDCLRLWSKTLAWSGRFSFAHSSALTRLHQSLALLERPELANQDIRQEKAFVLFNLADRYIGLDRNKARELLEPCLALYQELEISWGISVGQAELGRLDWGTGNYASALEMTRAGLKIQQELGDLREQVRSMNNLSWIYKHLGRMAEAEVLSRETLDLSRQLNDGRLLIENTADLAFVLWWQGQFAEMRLWAEDSLKICLDYGHLGLEGYARLAVSLSLLSTGLYEQAQREAALSLERVREANAHGVEATVHYCLGCLALVKGAQSDAQAEFNESLRLYLEVQDNYLGFALTGLAMMAAVFADLNQARLYSIEALKNAMNLRDSLWLWCVLPGISLFLAKSGNVARAVELWALAKTVPLINNSQWYADVFGAEIESSAAHLPAEAVDSARRRGQELDMWQVGEQLLAEFSQG